MSFKSYWKLFKIRSFSFLIVSGSVSQFGDRLTHMLLITLIGITVPGKVSAFSVASLTFTLPAIIFAPFIGILVDHWSRRSIILYSHIIQAALLGLIPLLVKFTNSFTPFWIIVTLFFSFDILNNTAKPAMMPTLVAKRKLLSANSLDQLLARIAMVTGMVLGGFLISKIGWQWGLITNALTHFTAGLLILGIAKSVDKKPLYEPHLRNKLSDTYAILINDIKEIFRLMQKEPIVNIALSSFALMTFIGSVSYTIVIFLVQQVLNWGMTGVGIFSGILALGMVIGAVVIGFFSIRVNKLHIIIVSIFIYGLIFIIGTFFINRIFAVIIALSGGVLFSFITVTQHTLLQGQVSSQIRGRIYAVKEFFVNMTFLITALCIGILSDLTSYKIMLFASGMILIVLSIFGLFYAPRTKLIDARA
jgi:MFS family permease